MMVNIKALILWGLAGLILGLAFSTAQVAALFAAGLIIFYSEVYYG